MNWPFFIGFAAGYFFCLLKVAIYMKRKKGLVDLEYEIHKARLNKELDQIAADRDKITASRGA